MEYIWAPWRIEYIKSVKPADCFLCTHSAQDKDVENLLLFRGTDNFIIMNRYPYNPGHLLVAPYRHIASLEELTVAERNEHFELVSRCVSVLKSAFKPGGFNIGANLGKVAGAGVEDHYHSHIVPRWDGDTNYVPVLGDVRVVPQALAETYDALRDKF